MKYFSKKNRLFNILLILLSLCSIGPKANATHFAAADIYVDYIGTDANDLTYRVTLVLYKACEIPNADLSPSEFIDYASVNAGFSETTPSIPGSPNDTLDQLCPNFKPVNSCRVDTSKFPAFVRKIYSTTVTLPSRQTDWVFSWSSGARNGGIKNISTIAGSASPMGNIYVEAGLNNVIRLNNSSPRFLIDPLPYICVNQPAVYLNGPFDPDGDSVAVASSIPLNAATNQYFYSPGYSFQNPLAATAANPYTVNTNTGTATFTPTQTGLFVLAFRCDEYQPVTGIPTGHVLRDVQLSVLSCSSAPPAIDTIPVELVNGAIISSSTQGNTVLACPNNPLSFKVTAKSQSGTNKVYMESNNTVTIPTSSYSIANNGGAVVTGTFTWTPTTADVGNHTLIVTAKDSTCDYNQPIVLKNYRVILIKVVTGLDAGPDAMLCAVGGSAKRLFVKNGQGLKLKWATIDGGPAIGLDDDTSPTPLAKPSVTTTYVVNTTDLGGACKNKDTVTIFIDTTNSIGIWPQNPIIMCRPGYLQLDAKPMGRPPLTNLPCGVNPTATSNAVDSVVIYSALGGSFDTLGPLTPTFPTNVKSTKQQYLLRKSELWESGLRSAAIKSLSFESILPPAAAYEYSNFRISMRCTDKTSLDASKGFESGMSLVYTASGPVTLAAGWRQFVFDVPYGWDTTKNLVIEICYSDNTTTLPAGNDPLIKFVPTNYIAGLTLKGTASDNVCGVFTSNNIGNNFSRPLFSFTYSESLPAPFPITWYPSTLLSDTTIQSPLAYIPSSIKYHVQTIGRNGCIVTDTAEVFVPTKNYTVSPSDTSICFGESPMLTAKGGFTYKWWEYVEGTYKFASSLSEDRVANPIASPKVTTTYKIVVYDSLWCTDTIETKLTVLPLPDIKILTRDTVVKYGQSLQLMVGGARTYNWMPAATLSTPLSSNPIATPTEATSYIAGGIGSNGCRSFDTINVGIDYKDNLFIPSAFSPNGDGRNDIFRVANLTFQKVSEFRVFNRWGQEIFATSGNKAGWDGNWKGVPQDLGNYSYQIRVAFPDGYVETYKGEVTLVR